MSTSVHTSSRRRLFALVSVAGVLCVVLLLVGLVTVLSPSLVSGSAQAPQPERPGAASTDPATQAGTPVSSAPVVLPATPLEPVTGTSFVVSSFNVLGNNHTLNGARGKRPGTLRIAWAAELLEAHQVTVAGLQEFQLPQLKAFRVAAPQFAMYPGARFGHRLTQNSIIWDRRVWRRERAETTPIPYFRGQPVRMPHVLLRHRVTRQQVWFMNYHNPAQVNGPAGPWRQEATSIEAALANDLMKVAPVVMTGDFNARRAFFCQVSREAPLHSADGGYRRNGECRPPAEPVVDWILGSPRVVFTEAVVDRRPRVKRISDHAMIRATATIVAAETDQN